MTDKKPKEDEPIDPKVEASKKEKLPQDQQPNSDNIKSFNCC